MAPQTPSPMAENRGPIGLAAVLLTVVATFQAALAAGAPWGAAAYGGYNRGTLPAKFRVASAASSLVHVGLALVAAGPRPGTTAKRRILRGAAGLMGVNTLMNLASRSTVERLLWTPTAAILAVTLLRVARNPESDVTQP
jgi:hypothetical protein